MTADLSKFAGLIDDFKKDVSKEQDGVWLPYGKFEYLIARAHRSNTKFLAMMEKASRPYQWAIQRDQLDAVKEVADEMMKSVYAATVLLGIRDAKTKTPLEYSPEDGVALFAALPDFWDFVFKSSAKESNYAPDAVELDSKN